MIATRSPALSAAVGALTTLLGQLVLLSVEPWTRAGSPDIPRLGLALLAPDSIEYLEDGESLNRLMDVPWNRWVYVALLFLAQRSGSAGTLIVLIQLTLASVGAALLHRIGQELAGGFAGLSAAALFVMNPLTAQWFRFLLTETLFFVLVILALFSTWRILTTGPTPRQTTIALTAAVLASGTRPNGILVLSAILTALLVVTSGSRRARTLAGMGVVWAATLGALLLGAIATGGPSERTFAAQLYECVIVEGDDRVVTRIEMPPAANPDAQELANVVRYVAANPSATARLVGARMLVEVAQVRRHLPSLLNFVLGSFMLVYFALAVAGWPSARPHLTRAATLLGLPMVLLVGATFAVPEGRYGWSALVLLAPIGGIGAARTLRAAGQAIGSVRSGDPSADGPTTAR